MLSTCLDAAGITNMFVNSRITGCGLIDGLHKIGSGEIHVMMGLKAMMLQGYAVEPHDSRQVAFSSTIHLCSIELEQFLGRARKQIISSCFDIRHHSTTEQFSEPTAQSEKSDSELLAQFAEFLKWRRPEDEVLRPVSPNISFSRQTPMRGTKRLMRIDKFCRALERFSEELNKE